MCSINVVIINKSFVVFYNVHHDRFFAIYIFLHDFIIFFVILSLFFDYRPVLLMFLFFFCYCSWFSLKISRTSRSEKEFVDLKLNKNDRSSQQHRLDHPDRPDRPGRPDHAAGPPGPPGTCPTDRRTAQIARAARTSWTDQGFFRAGQKVEAYSKRQIRSQQMKFDENQWKFTKLFKNHWK